MRPTELEIDQNRPQQILNVFPNDKMMPEDRTVSFLEKETNLYEGVIVNSINKLIKDRKRITAFDRTGKLFCER